MYEIPLDNLVIGYLKDLISHPQKKIVLVHNGNYPGEITSAFVLLNSLRKQQQRPTINYILHQGSTQDYDPSTHEYYVVDLNKIEVINNEDCLEKILNYEKTLNPSKS